MINVLYIQHILQYNITGKHDIFFCIGKRDIYKCHCKRSSKVTLDKKSNARITMVHYLDKKDNKRHLKLRLQSL